MTLISLLRLIVNILVALALTVVMLPLSMAAFCIGFGVRVAVKQFQAGHGLEDEIIQTIADGKRGGVA